jgi:hypothetical protein
MDRSIVYNYIFDQEVASFLLSLDNSIIPNEEKKMLNAMKKQCSYDKNNQARYSVKHSIDDNYMQYKNHKNEFGIGRMFPKQPCLSRIRKDIRDAMTYKYYWDIDFVNCHCNLALQYAKKVHVECPTIQDYCDRRDQIISTLMTKYDENRDQIKEQICAMLFGSKAGDKYKSDDFLNELKNEFSVLGTKVYNDFKKSQKDWDKLKSKKKPLLGNDPNKYCRSLAYLLHSIELECLQTVQNTLLQNNRKMELGMFDGGLVRKLDQETEFPKDLLRVCEIEIEQVTGFKLQIIEKPIVCKFELPSLEDLDEFRKVFGVTDFELSHFRIGDKFYREFTMFSTNRFEIVKHPSYFSQYNYKNVKTFQNFLVKHGKRVYKGMQFMPYGITEDGPIYNLFTGFAFEKLFSDVKVDDFPNYSDYLTKLKEYYNEKIAKKWLTSKNYNQYTKYICNDDPESITYFEQYMSHIICNPAKKIRKMLILTNKKGGTGKSHFIKHHFGDKLLGMQYWNAPSNFTEVLGNRNALLENLLLCVLEEADFQKPSKHDNDLQGAIKDFVDREYTNIRKMQTDPIKSKCFVNPILCTNKSIGIKFEKDNMRRFCVIECSEHRLSKTEQLELESETNCPEINKAFLLHLICNYREDFDFEQIPKSKLIQELAESSISIVKKFILFLFTEWNTYEMQKYSKFTNTPMFYWIDGMDFELSFSQIYDLFKYYVTNYFPKFDIMDRNKFSRHIDWLEFKKTYNIKTDHHSMYKCDYVDVRQKLKSEYEKETTNQETTNQETTNQEKSNQTENETEQTKKKQRIN